MLNTQIVFFSYARETLDPYLEDFFKDLSASIAIGNTPWAPEDDHVSFRDKENLRLGENWKSHIEGALQTSTVLVCITSVAYFTKEFCGKEYYFFDQRRRQGLNAGQDLPPVILPVIWAPVAGNPVFGELPSYLKDLQQVPPGIPDSYLKLGMRKLRRHDKALYDKCVDALADAVITAWQNHQHLPPLQNVQDFSAIPNMFDGNEWQEAAGPGGWLPGPEVANFVFVAQSKDDVPVPPGRYGKAARDWRPFLPPERISIFDQAKSATAKQFRFREIPFNDNLTNQLAAAKSRKNLSVVIGDPRALPLDSFAALRGLENLWWDGTALLLPCDDIVAKWDDADLQSALQNTFPTLHPEMVPLRSSDALKTALESKLDAMRNLVTKPEIEKLPKIEEPPPTVSIPGGSRS